MPPAAFTAPTVEAAATVVVAFASVVGFIFAGVQLRGSRAVAEAQFLFDLDRRLREYNDLHLKVVDAKWNPGTASNDEFDLARYLGVFERIEFLIDTGVMDTETVHRLYGYRVRTLVANNCARGWVENKPDSWTNFIKLWRRLDGWSWRKRGAALCKDHAPPP
jgi:hypothetical protein